MVKENIKVDFICRAKNSFGLAETTTTMIAALLAGIILVNFAAELLKYVNGR